MSLNLSGREVNDLLCILERAEFDEKDEKKARAYIKKMQKSLVPIKTSSAKGKGREFQKWVATRISEFIGIPFEQGDYSLIQVRQMGQSGVDVILRDEALEKFSFAVECKNTEKLNLNNAIEQSRKGGRLLGLDWLLCYKNKSMRNPVVIMDFVRWLERGVW